MEMANIVLAMEHYFNEIHSKIHCGPSFIASAKILHQALENATEAPTRHMRMFESYSAQTKLPKGY